MSPSPAKVKQVITLESEDEPGFWPNGDTGSDEGQWTPSEKEGQTSPVEKAGWETTGTSPVDKLLDGKPRGLLQKLVPERDSVLFGTFFFLCIPLALMSIIMAFFPRAAVQHGGDISLELFRSSSSGKDKLPFSKRYAVIFDAGSSGSRVHVYCFDDKKDLVKVGSELAIFLHVEPGLSDFAQDPKRGAESIQPMLDEALQVVPVEQHSTTPVRLGATAGLRLLPGDEAVNLLQEVQVVLKNSSFMFQPDWVNVIDGTQEGSYQWVTINYLRGNLGKKYDETVGIVDLGGGSVQMAYAISDENYYNAPKAGKDEVSSVQQIKLLGRTYNLYVHSYLHYGLLALRAEVFKHTGNTPCPCLAKDYEGGYQYAGENHVAQARDQGPHFADCQALILDVLKVDHSCKHMKCTFGGVWNGGGGLGFKQLFVASFFFDKAADAGIIKDKKVASAVVTPADFEEAAKKFCSLSLAEISQEFPKLKEEKKRYICLDLVYQYTLLVVGFGIDPQQELTLVKKIMYRGSEVEAAWPLGSAIELVSGYQ